MSGLLWGAREEEQPKSWWASLTDGFALTYYQRIVGFGVSFAIGLVFCFMVRPLRLPPLSAARSLRGSSSCRGNSPSSIHLGASAS